MGPFKVAGHEGPKGLLGQPAELGLFFVLLADQLVDGHWFGLALDPDQVQDAEVELVLGRLLHRLADDYIHPVGLGLALQPGAQVDVVADDGVVEAQMGTQVAHDHGTGVDADADDEVRHFHLVPDRLKGVDFPHHIQGGPAGPLGVVFLGHRRAPDGHDRVADVLVQDAVVGEDDGRHLIQVGVEGMGEDLRLQPLGDGGEAANVGEEDGQLLLLAAQAQIGGVLQDGGDDRGVEVVLEGVADPLLLPFLGQIAVGDDRHARGGQGQDGMDGPQQPAVQEEVVGQPEVGRPGQDGQDSADDRSGQGDEQGGQQGQGEDGGHIEESGPAGPDEVVAGEDVVHHLSLDLHPRMDRGKGGRAHILDADGRDADDDRLVRQGSRLDPAGQNVRGLVDLHRAGAAPEVDPHPPPLVHRNLAGAQFDRLHAEVVDVDDRLLHP